MKETHIKKEFQIDIPIESDTEYFATESEYHVYAKDTVEKAPPMRHPERRERNART